MRLLFGCVLPADLLIKRQQKGRLREKERQFNEPHYNTLCMNMTCLIDSDHTVFEGTPFTCEQHFISFRAACLSLTCKVSARPQVPQICKATAVSISPPLKVSLLKGPQCLSRKIKKLLVQVIQGIQAKSSLFPGDASALCFAVLNRQTDHWRAMTPKHPFGSRIKRRR